MQIYVLVGTNPLPCYLSVLYLLDYYQEQNTVFLVCSEKNPQLKQGDTKSIAERIKTELKSKNPTAEVRVKTISDISSNSDLEAFVKKNVECKIAHLNYTGGTKTMAALIYYHMKQKLKGFSSSYLDSRSHRMIMDVAQIPAENPLYASPSSSPEKLRHSYKVDLNVLTNLHGMLPLKPAKESKFPDAEKWLNERFDRHLKGEPHPFFDLEKGFRKTDLYKYLKGEKDSVSTDEPSKYIDDLELRELIETMPEEYKTILQGKIVNKGKKHICEFLDGKWFESFIHAKLQALEEPYISIHANVEAEFELDIVIIYGYQLSVISITTSKRKGLVKQKAFEAIHRARQLGGDETKMVIISFLNEINTNLLKKELKVDVGSTFPNYKILGFEDLKKENTYENIIRFIKDEKELS